MSKPSPFRVIIVGGGLTGLSLAHLLKAANIDYVLLERRSGICDAPGSLIALWPSSVRVFDQIGLLEAANDCRLKVDSKGVMEQNGSVVREFPIFSDLEKRHGYPPHLFLRPQLTKLLYDGLQSDRSRIKASSVVKDLKETDHGVEAILEDDTTEKGSIVIGADGVHSQVLEAMNRNAEQDGLSIKKRERLASYKVLFGNGPAIPDKRRGVFWDSRGMGIATQFANFDDISIFTVYMRLEKPVPVTQTITEEEKLQFIEQTAGVFLAPDLKFGDVQEYCTWNHLTYQSEGILDVWQHRRIVLCGESAAQMTSIAGMGFNCGFNSAVVLVNKLHATLHINPDPEISVLKTLMAEYQSSRWDETKFICNSSAFYLRTTCWNHSIVRLLVRHVLPIVFDNEKVLNKLSRDVVAKGRVLDFLRTDLRSGDVPWEYPVPKS